MEVEIQPKNMKPNKINSDTKKRLEPSKMLTKSTKELFYMHF